MMITFSTSGIDRSRSFLTSLCIVPTRRESLRCYPLTRRARGPALPPPALDGLAQLEVGDHAGDERQPERERAVDQHGHDREAAVDAERRVGGDQATLDP